MPQTPASQNPAASARFPWPPALVALALAGGFALGPVAPDWPLARAPSLAIGGVIILCALAVDLWCASLFRRRHTTLAPHRAASTLIVDGPYRYSRNPIYIAHICLVIGIGVFTRASGVLLLAPVLALALDRLSAAPEEKRLAEQFGPEFRAFAARTRRWI